MTRTNSTIKVKKCKCGCDKYPTTGFKGYNSSCVPEEERQNFTKRKVSQRKVANLRNLSTAIHKAQNKVNGLKVPLKRQQKPIAKNSKKRLVELKIYNLLRKDFLKDNIKCLVGVEGCKKKSSDVHHMRGRGIWLNVVEWWLPICRNCHTYITEHSKEAIELGFSVSRLTK